MTLSAILASLSLSLVAGASADAQVLGRPCDAPGAVAVVGVVDVNAYGGVPVRAHPFVCSGVLIAPDVVLTAAHCMDETLVRAALPDGVELAHLNFAVSPGADLSGHAQQPIGLPPADAVFVSSRAIPDTDLLASDLAVLFLSDVLNTAPAPIAAPGALNTQGQALRLSGYGGEALGTRTCASGAVDLVDGAHFTFEGGTCPGDSGGPVYIDDELVGTMNGGNCATRGTGTTVDNVRVWLDDTLRDGCARGVRAWCEVEGLPSAHNPVPPTGGCSSTTPVDAPLLLGLGVLFAWRRSRSAPRRARG